MRTLPLALVLALGVTRFVAADLPLNAKGGGPPPPLHVKRAYDIRGLTLWITAEDGITTDAKGQVTQLIDKTGNFTLTRPDGHAAPTQVLKALNGYAVLRFNGQQSLYSPYNFGNAQDGAMTFITVSLGTAAEGDEQFQLYLGQNSMNHCNRSLCHFKGREMLEGQFVGCYGPPVLRNVFFMDGAALNRTHMRTVFFRDGKKIMVSRLNPEDDPAARFDQVSDGVTLGAAPTNLFGWQGDIAEALVFDRALTEAEMQTIWNALSAKYGLGQQPAPKDTTSPGTGQAGG